MHQDLIFVTFMLSMGLTSYNLGAEPDLSFFRSLSKVCGLGLVILMIMYCMQNNSLVIP